MNSPKPSPKKYTFDFTCSNAFGLWTVEDPDEIKKRRCQWNCNCHGKGIKVKLRSVVQAD
jgi:hypothetical protein